MALPGSPGTRHCPHGATGEKGWHWAGGAGCPHPGAPARLPPAPRSPWRGSDSPHHGGDNPTALWGGRAQAVPPRAVLGTRTSLRCQQRAPQIVPNVPKRCCRRPFPAGTGHLPFPTPLSPCCHHLPHGGSPCGPIPAGLPHPGLRDHPAAVPACPSRVPRQGWQGLLSSLCQDPTCPGKGDRGLSSGILGSQPCPLLGTPLAAAPSPAGGRSDKMELPAGCEGCDPPPKAPLGSLRSGCGSASTICPPGPGGAASCQQPWGQ